MQELDEQAIANLKELNLDGLLLRLVNLYGEESPKLIAQIETAIDERNLPDLEMAAHTLKASSAQLGALRFSVICRKLEFIGSGDSPFDQASDLCPLLNSQLSKVMEQLYAIIENSSGADTKT